MLTRQYVELNTRLHKEKENYARSYLSWVQEDEIKGTKKAKKGVEMFRPPLGRGEAD